MSYKRFRALGTTRFISPINSPIKAYVRDTIVVRN